MLATLHLRSLGEFGSAKALTHASSICNKAWARSRAGPAVGKPAANCASLQLDRSRWPGSEMNGIRGTSFNTGRNIIRGIDFSLSCGRRFFFGRMQPCMAEIAFLDDSSHAHGDSRVKALFHSRRPRRIPPVEITRMIRTRGHAVAATQATLRHLHDDSSCLIHFHRLLRANLHAGRVVLAMHAHDGDKCFAAGLAAHFHSRLCGREGE